MTFYTAIAKYYDLVFPLNPAQIRFTHQFLVPGLISQRVLDLGCATGKLAVALAEDQWQVEGVDSDAIMIKMARERKGNILQVQFHQLDMMEVGGYFSDSSFQVVLCYGNTLAHLSGIEEIKRLFKQAYNLLEEEGALLIQVVNYDHVLEQKVSSLPVIDREQVRFIREYQQQGDQIRFLTRLEIKERRETLENEVLLYPVTRSQLSSSLSAAGFRDIRFYANFNGDEYQPDGMGLVVAAKRV